ncbi:Peptidyl-prolyl cis-trans isomerase [Hondaea fermentalgiana]|uniref:peptidylprolyl isomerase n=1 Tax=Hondaea fermentalgiana TaxID=2315210 RepID=A0A2R5GTT3_9STRA|nr:Peptidyl-prolyl cis-trans isomerase [Hondaea fermentalgiana]|eukprot:GBG34287.1 Peptidyl-prolyl cis-trans isomerase [Hondaea fermentalgiana]
MQSKVPFRCASALLLAVLALAGLDLATADNAASEAFLASYEEDHDDVRRLPSGVMYRVLQAATSPAAKSPMVDDLCKLNYEGKLVTGVVFDSSLERGEPAYFTPSQVIEGWKEALQEMEEGDKWEVVIPSALAYGEKGAGEKIPADSALVFEIELLEVNPEFQGMDWVKQQMRKDIPGLPFKLSVWQGVLLAGYISLRVFMRQYMDRRATPRQPAPAQQQAKGTKSD